MCLNGDAVETFNKTCRAWKNFTEGYHLKNVFINMCKSTDNIIRINDFIPFDCGPNLKKKKKKNPDCTHQMSYK